MKPSRRVDKEYALAEKAALEFRVMTNEDETNRTRNNRMIFDASGVTETGTTMSGVLKRRDPAKKFKIAFHRENGTDLERYISKQHAYIDSISRSFSDGESLYEVTVVIVPTAASELFDYYKGPKP